MSIRSVLALDRGWPGSEAGDHGDLDPARPGAVDGSLLAAAVALRYALGARTVHPTAPSRARARRGPPDVGSRGGGGTRAVEQ